MKRAVPILIWLIALLLDCSCQAFTITSPPDKSILTGNTASLVISLTKGEANSIRVLDNNRASREKAAGKNVDTLCLQIALGYGLNTLEVQAVRDGSIVGRKTIQLYLQGRLGTNTNVPPAMFTPYVFHTSAHEKGCRTCHQLEPQVRDLTPDPPESSSCMHCHAAQAKGAVIHYPAGKGLCLFCHQVTDSKEKYVVRDREQEYCFVCHSDQIKTWQNQPVIHGPVGKGQCSLCHDPHNSAKDALLRMHTTDLCITCHEDKATGAHVISGFYGKGHPVRGVPNPLNPQREFTCAGCHNPHAGQNRDLLRHNRENMTEYCLLCHKL